MMSEIGERIEDVRRRIEGSSARLVAVSKYHPADAILDAYENAGQRIFGESHALEVRDKHETLPKDIEWHFIGHLQTNKVKYIAPFVALIHSVDSVKLMEEIEKQAEKCGRVIECLLEVRIAEEETKYGLGMEDVRRMYADRVVERFKHLKVVGLMGMATATGDAEAVEREFRSLAEFFEEAKRTFGPDFRELSMGMSGDYEIAARLGSTLVRVGSYIFGNRVY